jgi:hypothetical protein
LSLDIGLGKDVLVLTLEITLVLTGVIGALLSITLDLDIVLVLVLALITGFDMTLFSNTLFTLLLKKSIENMKTKPINSNTKAMDNSIVKGNTKSIVTEKKTMSKQASNTHANVPSNVTNESTKTLVIPLAMCQPMSKVLVRLSLINQY